MSIGEKMLCTLHLQNSDERLNGCFFQSLNTFSVLTIVIIWFLAFYINPQLGLGANYFNINQKYLRKMNLTNNEFNRYIFLLIDHRLRSQIAWDGNVPLWVYSCFLTHDAQDIAHSLMLIFPYDIAVEVLTSNHLQ